MKLQASSVVAATSRDPRRNREAIGVKRSVKRLLGNQRTSPRPFWSWGSGLADRERSHGPFAILLASVSNERKKFDGRNDGTMDRVARLGPLSNRSSYLKCEYNVSIQSLSLSLVVFRRLFAITARGEELCTIVATSPWKRNYSEPSVVSLDWYSSQGNSVVRSDDGSPNWKLWDRFVILGFFCSEYNNIFSDV